MLCKVDEVVRHDEAALGMLPTGECLDTDDAAGQRRNLWLVVHDDLAVLDRATQISQELQPLDGVAVVVQRIQADRIALFFCGVKRDVGASQQGGYVDPVLRCHRHSDTRSDVDADAVGCQWRGQCAQRDVRNDQDGSGLDVGHEHRKLVTTKAAHHRIGAERRGQPIRGRLDHLVANVVPERVVDLFEVVEVDDHQSRRRASRRCSGQHGGCCSVEQGAVRQAGQGVVQRLLLALDGKLGALVHGGDRQHQKRQREGGEVHRDYQDGRQCEQHAGRRQVVAQVHRHPPNWVLAQRQCDDDCRDHMVDDEEHDRRRERADDITRPQIARVFEEAATGHRRVREARRGQGNDVLRLVEDDPAQILALAHIVEEGRNRLRAERRDEWPGQHEGQAERAGDGDLVDAAVTV